MANNCVGVYFDASCNGSGNLQFVDEYLAEIGVPPPPDPYECVGFATDAWQNNNCGSMRKPRLTSGISRMRSASGEAGAVSNDTIRKYAQFALVISLVALSVNIYSMRKKK